VEGDAGAGAYTFHWNLFEDYTYKTYCNWIDTEIIREWYQHGPLKHVGKDCLEAVKAENATLPKGVTREGKRTQEEDKAMAGETWVHPVERDEVHKFKRGDVTDVSPAAQQTMKETMTPEEWERLHKSLRMKDMPSYRAKYGWLLEYFMGLGHETPAEQAAAKKYPQLPGCRMLNELILGVVGANDGIGFHWDRGSYSQLYHEEDAVSTWVQFSDEGPGMSMLRQRDLCIETWENGLQGQNFEPASAEAKEHTKRATLPCPTMQGSLIIFDRREIHRTTPIERDYDAPLKLRTVSVARWIAPDAPLSGAGKDVPLHAIPNAMQAYMLGARNYFLRPLSDAGRTLADTLRPNTSVYRHAARPKGPDGACPRVDEKHVESIFPELIHGKFPTQFTIDYTQWELWKDYPWYYKSEFMQKWNSGKLTTPARWWRLVREFPLHSRFD